jgi:hypothetical protein
VRGIGYFLFCGLSRGFFGSGAGLGDAGRGRRFAAERGFGCGSRSESSGDDDMGAKRGERSSCEGEDEDEGGGSRRTTRRRIRFNEGRRKVIE